MRTLAHFLDARLNLRTVLRAIRDSQPESRIPLSRAPAVSMGRFTLMLLALLLLSGVALTYYYQPTAAGASVSLETLHRERPLGWLIHNTHRWSSLLILVTAVLHLLRAWLARAFRPPRDLNWWLGLSLFMTLFVLGGTGYILRWDIKATALMDLVVSNLGDIPVVGQLLVDLFLGGSVPGVIPLYRGYALHIWALPALLILLVGLHLLIAWRQGLSTGSSAWDRLRGRFDRKLDPLPALLLLALVLGLSFVTPHFGDAPAEFTSPWPHPDWLLMAYFMPFWFFRGEWRLVGALLVPLAVLAGLIAIPRLETRLRRGLASAIFGFVGIVGVALLLGATASMGASAPIQGCRACHQPGMLGSAPTSLSDFRTDDPDWLVLHMKQPVESILQPRPGP